MRIERSVAGGDAGPLRQPRRLLERLLAALPDDMESFQRLCAGAADWSPLIEEAERQGVWAALSHALLSCEDTVPPVVREQAGHQRASAQLVQMPLLTAQDQAMNALDAAGVRAVALKGLLLGERLYCDPSLRLSADLDLLVAPADLERATAALAALGYQAETGLRDQYYRTHTHHISLHRSRSPIIELHFRLYTGFGIVIPAEPFLGRAVPYRSERGRMAWILAPEDEFLHLAVHAAGHRFATLSLLYDLKLLLRRYPDLDWALMAARARSMGVTTVLAFTAEMLRRHLGVPIPRQQFPVPGGARGWVAHCLAAPGGDAPDSSRLSTLGLLLFQLLLCDRFVYRARSLRGHWRLKRHLKQLRKTGLAA